MRKILTVLVLVMFLFSCDNKSPTVPKATINSVVIDNDFRGVTFQVEITDKSNLLKDASVKLHDGDSTLYSVSLDMVIKSKIYAFQNLKENSAYSLAVYATYDMAGSSVTNQLIAEYAFNTNVPPDDDIRLLSQSFAYNGEIHFLEINNLPDLATVVWLNNGQSEIGHYYVTAEVYLNGVLLAKYSAYLFILDNFPAIILEDQTVEYTGYPVLLTYYVSPNYDYEVTYDGSADIPTDCGEYEVRIALDNNVEAKAVLRISKAEVEIRVDSYVVTDIDEIDYIVSFNLPDVEYETTLTDNIEIPGIYPLLITVPATMNYDGIAKVVYIYAADSVVSTELFLSEVLFTSKNSFIEMYNNSTTELILRNYELHIEYQSSTVEIVLPEAEVKPKSTYAMSNYAFPYINLVKQFNLRNALGVSLVRNGVVIDSLVITTSQDNFNFIRKAFVNSPGAYDSFEWISLTQKQVTIGMHWCNDSPFNTIPEIVFTPEVALPYGTEVDYSDYITLGHGNVVFTIDAPVVDFDQPLGTRLPVVYTLVCSDISITVTIMYTIVDNDSPEIIGETELFFPLGEEINEEEIIASYSITDNYDAKENLQIFLSHQSDIATSVNGHYLVYLHAIDTSLNEAIYPILLVYGNVEVTYAYQDLKEEGPNKQKSMPSLGNAHVIVIPLYFSNHAQKDFTEDVRNIFFADNASLSVARFMHQSSYGKLMLSGSVLEKYMAPYPSYYYNSEEKMSQLLFDALEFYRKNGIDFRNYDGDNNDIIDGIFLVHNYVSQDIFDVNYLMNPFTLPATRNMKYNDKSVGLYTALSYYSNRDNVINPYIKQTGMLLGLEDLSDRNPLVGPNGGLGGESIMDSCLGDFTSFEKILLGWVTPTIINQSSVISIRAFSEYGDCLIITNKDFDPFGEYFIVDLYTNTALNAIDSVYAADTGVRIYHVDSSYYLSHKGEYVSNGGVYDSYYHNDNSDTMNKLIRLLEADYDGKFDIEDNKTVTSSDLYNSSVSFGYNNYQSYKLYDRSSLYFRLRVSEEGKNAKVSISFTS